ncbi:MAG: hypothetical protein OCD02_11250 [Spirochaetaceae bacterium]
MENDKIPDYLKKFLSELKLEIRNELEEHRRYTIAPEFLNKSKIASKWGYASQGSLIKWQLPDFGIPAFFNGRSPMYGRSAVNKIINNPKTYKEKWSRLTVNEKIAIQKQYVLMKRQDSYLE